MPYEAARLYVTVGAETREAEAGLRAMGQKVDSFADSMKNGLLQGAGIAAFNAAIQGLSASFGVLKSAGVDYNGLLEQTRIAFTTMLAPVVNGFKDMTAGASASFAMMQNLREFAAKTPFEFPELVKNTQRLLAMGFAAEEVIPQLEAIGNVSAAYGKGTEGISRMTLALGQMSAATVVHKEDLNQLIDVGVPVWDILSAKTGKNAQELQDLVSQGQISSDFFISAFNEWANSNFGDMMAQQAKTFSGALSNVQDALRDTIAGAAEPFFNRMRDGMVALGDFLGSAGFKLWASAAAAAMESAGQAFDGLLASLAPVGSAIADVFAKLSEGDVAGAMASLGKSVQDGLGAAMEIINRFGEGMFGAGWNLITELGSGIAGAFGDVIDVVADGLASLAAMLIGQSPPPSGPLSAIDKGGANAGKAWGDPFAAMLKESAQTGVAAVGTAVDGLKAKSKAVADQMHEIEAASKDLERAMRGVREQIDSVKDGFAEQIKTTREAAETAKQGYQDALAGVRERMDAIKESTAQQTEAIQTQIETTRDHYESAMQAVRDEIDSVKDRFDAQLRSAQDEIERVKDKYRDALQTARDEIDRTKDRFSDQTKAAQDQIDSVKDRYSSALDAIKTRIDAIKRASEDQIRPLELQLKNARDQIGALREQEDLQRKLQNAATAQLRIKALGDPRLRAELQGQLAGLDVQEQALGLAEDIADVQKKLNDPATTAAERARLQIRLQQLQIQQRLNGMIDQGAIAEAAKQDALQSAQEAQLRITREIEDANRRIVEIPIERKIAEIKKQAEAALTPLQTQMAALERDQKAALDPLEDNVKRIKREEQDALKPLQDRLKQLGVDQKAALEPLTDRIKELKQQEKDALRPLEQQAKDLQREAQEAARTFDGMIEGLQRQQEAALKPLEAQLKAYQDQKEQLAIQKEALADIKRGIDDAAKAAKDAAKGGAPEFSLKPGQQRVARKPLDPNAVINAEDLKRRGTELADKLADGFKEQLEKRMGLIIGAALGAAIGGIAFGPIGAIIGAALGGAIGEKVQEKLAAMGITPEALLQGLSDLVTKIRDQVGPAFELFLTNANNLFKTLDDNRDLIAGIVASFTAFLVLGKIAAIVTTVVAAIGPFLAALGTVASVVGSIIAIFTETGSITIALGAAFTALSGPIAAVVALLGGPVTLIIAAVALAIGVLTAAWVGNWGDIQGKTFAAWEAIKGTFSAIVEWFGTLEGAQTDFKAAILSAWESIKTGVSTAVSGLGTAISTAWDGIKGGTASAVSGLMASIGRTWDTIKQKTTEVWDGIKAYLMSFWNAIPDDIRADLVLIYNALSERFAAMLVKVSESVEAIKTKIMAVIGAVVTWLSDRWAEIGTSAATKWGNVSTSIQDAVTAVQKWLSDRWGEITRTVSDTWDKIVAYLTPVVDGIKRALSSAWDTISRTASEKWGEILRFFDSTFGAALRSLQEWTRDFVTSWGTWARDMAVKAKETGDAIIRGLWDGVNSLRQWLVDGFWDLIRFFLGKIKEALGIASPSTVFFDYGVALIQGLLNGVKSLWDGATGFLATFTGYVAAFLHAVMDKLGIPDNGTESSVFSRVGQALINGFKAGVTAIWTAGTGILGWIGGLVTEFVGRWYTGFGWQGAPNEQTGELKNIGSAVINAFWNGLKANVAGLLNWLKTEVVDKIPETIRKALGINSPSRVMFDLGVHTMSGLVNGLRSKLGDLNGIQGLISKLLSGLGGHHGIPSSPEQVKNWLMAALNAEGAPASWLPALQIIAQGESTNDPTAVNPVELFSNGKSLGHATGLMQVAQGTFDWLNPGKDIFDPIQNAIASLRWIKFKYGDAYNVPGVRSVLSGGPYLPYRSGGVTSEDIYGVGPSGRNYVIHKQEGIFSAEQMRRLAPIGALRPGNSSPSSVQNITLLGNVYGWRDFESHLIRSDTLNQARGRNVNIWNQGGRPS